MKVCEKVEGKGRTTYNEVADELVNDLPGQHEPGEASCIVPVIFVGLVWQNTVLFIKLYLLGADLICRPPS